MDTSTKKDDSALVNFRWWERGIIYQIYPRSFMDGNGDGIGDLAGIRQRLDYLELLGVDAIWISLSYAWPNWVLGNHDKPRIATRAGAPQARITAMLLLTLRGTPTMYYGDEIAMHDVAIPPHQVQDPFEKNVPGLGLGRDPVRTPMQWDESRAAGFTTGQPWLPIADDCAMNNVAVLRCQSASILSLYRRLIELRRSEPALSVGDYAALPSGEDLMAYMRKVGERRLLIVLNFGAAARRFNLSELQAGASLLLSTYLDRAGEKLAEELQLRGDEGVIIELL